MDSELEQLIDRAGRDHVFDRAREMGWSPFPGAPKWVWRTIALELIAARDAEAHTP